MCTVHVDHGPLLRLRLETGPSRCNYSFLQRVLIGNVQQLYITAVAQLSTECFDSAGILSTVNAPCQPLSSCEGYSGASLHACLQHKADGNAGWLVAAGVHM